MEKDEDLNNHYSHTGIANSKFGGDKILSRFLSEPNKFMTGFYYEVARERKFLLNEPKSTAAKSSIKSGH